MVGVLLWILTPAKSGSRRAGGDSSSSIRMTSGPVHEVTPLLADPPIDDESYRREARTFPSDEQKHLMFVSYTLTVCLSRFCEISSTLLMSLVFPRNLIPVTFFSFLILANSSYSQRAAYFVARLTRSRLSLLSLTIVVQRLSMIVFALLIINRREPSHWYFEGLMTCGLALNVIFLKASLALYQSAFRRDWLYILYNGKDSVRVQFETFTHTLSVILQLLLPVATGVLVSSTKFQDFSRVVAFTNVLGLFVELSLIWKLHSTCYALYLPRSPLSLETPDQVTHALVGPVDLHPMIGVLTTPVDSMWLSDRFLNAYNRPLPRIFVYVRRKPIPVIVTFGAILINVSLITIGPHMVWYFLKMGMSATSVGFLKSLQTLVTLHPAMSAPKAFNLTSISAILAVFFVAMIRWDSWDSARLWLYFFAFSVVFTRSGVPTINLISDQFVEDYLANEDIHKVYKENAAWLRTLCELLVHVLTLMFPSAGSFIYPIGISTALTLLGRILILHTIRKFWRPDQSSS